MQLLDVHGFCFLAAQLSMARPLKPELQSIQNPPDINEEAYSLLP